MEDTEEETEDGGEEQQTEGMVPHSVGVVQESVTILVDLLGNETEKSDIDADPEDEEGEEELLSTSSEELGRGCGSLSCCDDGGGRHCKGSLCV